MVRLLRRSNAPVSPPPAPTHTTPYTSLNGILNDSYSPALILPKRDTHPSFKIYYSHLRHLISTLESQAPFSQLRPQDVLTFLLPNSLEFVGVFFATTGVRAIANPLNPAYTADEIAFYIKDVGSKALIVPKGDQRILEATRAAVKSVGVDIPIFEVWMDVEAVLRKDKPVKKIGSEKRVAVVSPVVHVHPVDGNAAKAVGPVVRPEDRGAPVADDIALMLHTSGTTGRPKGVPLSHGNILTTLRNITETYNLQASDASYIVMPLFHVHGLIGALLSTFYSGGTAIVPPKFSVSHFWSDFLEHGATWYSAVPTIHQMLLLKVKESYKGDKGKLRFIRSCSSSLAPATLLQLEKTFHTPVIEAYAMSEAAHQVTANFLPPGMRKPGSIGQGRGVEVAILDGNGQPIKTRAIGEVCIRGPNVIKGYHNNEKATSESFFPDFHQPPTGGLWFRTGDLGYMDEMSYVFLVGRIKEQINRGGEKISPLEIDQVLLHHKGVSEACAFGVPSDIYGEEIEVAVVPKDEWKGKLKEAELVALLKKNLAPFKVPRRVLIVDTLPKTATGKVQRRNVAEQLSKRSAGQDQKVKAKL
ncbi:hypothetical protein DFS34DRAFT_643420 [Phlyctochytrium arcticum]|nr:hypothetical protein DFS34DRAFT_643420 [Phlyctochytrium arcticum]